MLSLIIGLAIGHWSSSIKRGLIVVIVYGAIAGIVTANLTNHEAAMVRIPIVTLTGFGISAGIRLVRWLSGAKE